MKYIDLRSDTVTQPTEEMRHAMAEAEVGDDIYHDDPTTRRLEELAAARLGKEAALLMVSGTMGNQVAIMAHTNYGNELITGMQNHIIVHECGAFARLSGVCAALADNPDCFIYAKDVARLTREDDIHAPKTALVCVENALGNGDVVPLSVMGETYDEAHRRGLPVHLDGARIFNAALALGVEAKEIASYADSVMFCISKGLCAPVGSLLCGTREFIDHARHMRKIVGGGMRQCGILAAAGIIAMEKMTLRLGEDHENAQYLARQLSQIPGIVCDPAKSKINMVFWQTKIPGFSSPVLTDYLQKLGIKVSTVSDEHYRFVTHNDISRADLDIVMGHLKGYIASL